MEEGTTAEPKFENIYNVKLIYQQLFIYRLQVNALESCLINKNPKNQKEISNCVTKYINGYYLINGKLNN